MCGRTLKNKQTERAQQTYLVKNLDFSKQRINDLPSRQVPVTENEVAYHDYYGLKNILSVVSAYELLLFSTNRYMLNRW